MARALATNSFLKHPQFVVFHDTHTARCRTRTRSGLCCFVVEETEEQEGICWKELHDHQALTAQLAPRIL